MISVAFETYRFFAFEIWHVQHVLQTVLSDLSVLQNGALAPVGACFVSNKVFCHVQHVLQTVMFGMSALQNGARAHLLGHVFVQGKSTAVF